MGAEEKELTWAFGLVVAVIVVAILIVVCGLRWLTGSWLAASIVMVVLIVGGGFIPIGNGYSIWGMLRLAIYADWKY